MSGIKSSTRTSKNLSILWLKGMISLQKDVIILVVFVMLELYLYVFVKLLMVMAFTLLDILESKCPECNCGTTFFCVSTL